MKRWLMATLCTLAFFVGCVAYAGKPAPQEKAVADGTVVTAPRAVFRVKNENWNLIRVYLSENGNPPFRIGSVDATRTESFRVPIHGGASYIVVVVPLAGSPFATEPIVVFNGDTLNVRVANYLPFTSIIPQRAQ